MEKLIILTVMAAWVAWAGENPTVSVHVESLTSEEVAARKAAILAIDKAQENLKVAEEKIAKAHGSTTGYQPLTEKVGSQWLIASPSVYVCNKKEDFVEFRGGYLIVTTTQVNTCPAYLTQ